MAAPNLPLEAARFKRDEWLSLLLWPLLGLILCAQIWSHTLDTIEQQAQQAKVDAWRHVAEVAETYALQLGHTIEQIDLITLRLKYAWEDNKAGVDLLRDAKRGLFPANHEVYASIFDGHGRRLTGTLERLPQVSVADLPYFQFHQTNCCAGLLISEPSPGRTFSRQVVRFSRRLNYPDGSFAGIVAVYVEPSYLTSFQVGATPGQGDFITARLTNGPVLATKVGNHIAEAAIFYRQAPTFPVVSGVTLEPAEKFTDETERFVAWRKLRNYPVMAIAAVSAHGALANTRDQAAQMRDAALLQSVAIMTMAVVVMLFAVRLAKRRRQGEDTQATYRLATDTANEGFYMLRPLYDINGKLEDFRLDDCNERAAEFIGKTRAQLLGLRTLQLQPASFGFETFALCQLALEKGRLEEEVRVSPHSALQAKWIFRRLVKSPAGLAMTIRDISEEKQQVEALADLANTDTLTRLPNRNWLNAFLPDAVRHASQHSGHLAVLFLDLDNFKNINDTLGHDAGDELLAQAAYRLKETVRASDHVARLGGDEFVIILDNVATIDHIAQVAEAVISMVSKPYQLAAGIGSEICASIGISVFPQDGTDPESLLKHADIAMYAAKEDGKGRHVFYQPHLSESLILRLDNERALREAARKDEFVVHYQPRVNIDSGEMTSMEALVRWQRPDRELVYPGEFIGPAEDVGLINKVGELVIEKVCSQIAQWKKQNLPLVPVSINISAQQLKSGTLSGYLASRMQQHGINPSLIEAELTESAVIDNSTTVSDELAALRALGIKLLIDDFGTGYSSMAQLHWLDVDVLKVDKAFTQSLVGGPEGKLLFGAIMSMASALGMSVVAEGVECKEELDALKSLACTEIQGHLVSKAVDAKEMAQLMAKRFLFPTSAQRAYIGQHYSL